MKNDKLTKHQSDILDILIAIKERRFYGVVDKKSIRNPLRISRGDLQRQLGYRDRDNRDAIHKLRKKGYPICSDTRGGYWLGTDAEWEKFRQFERQVALSRMYPAIKKDEDYSNAVTSSEVPTSNI